MKTTIIPESSVENAVAWRRNILICNAIFILLLSGCATLKPTVSNPDFVLGGKIGFQRTTLEGGEEGGSARFQWTQTGGRYQIDLWGVFGQGRTRLTGDARAMQVTNGSGEVLLVGAPEVVMQQRLGWMLPVEVLPDWLWGLPTPAFAVKEAQSDDAGRLSGFSQIGWRVSLGEYRSFGEGEQPRRVTIRRPGFTARVIVAERAGKPLI
ncbi:MAG: outer membrane lipoprotein LolB [Pseudomonadales bacterium]|nr:outer membrane lipoprotein LolB [Pseudomonadales bacterium]